MYIKESWRKGTQKNKKHPNMIKMNMEEEKRGNHDIYRY